MSVADVEKFAGHVGLPLGSNATIVQPLPLGRSAHDQPPFTHSGSAQSIRPLQLSSTPFEQFSGMLVHEVVHTPFTQLSPLVHAVAAPHSPAELHVSMSLPEHFVAFGAQTPVQVPFVHTYGHAEPLSSQLPVASHVWGWRPLHCEEPLTHVPWQAPLTHVWPVQMTGALHWPLEPQVSTPLFEHVVVPGVHTPPQAAGEPATHTYVHAVGVPHWPLALHDSTSVLSAHCVLLGVQTPVHAPLAQTYGHDDGLPQVPFA
jgi:hypothetical protein